MNFWETFFPMKRIPSEVSSYRRLEYVGAVSPGNAAGERNLDKTLAAAGDHLTIHNVTGGMPVYVRLNGSESDPNPFIRVREGMVLSHPFKSVTFRSGNARGRNALPGILGAKVIAFASHGPLIAHMPAKEYGMRRLPIMRYGLIATTSNTELGSLLRASADSEGYPTLGKGGGTLLITNTDLANDLYLVAITGFGQTLAAGTSGYGPLRPGQSISLQLEDILFSTNDAPDGGGIVAKTLSGTCTYSVICSSAEMDDVDSDQSSEHHQGMK